MIYTTLTKKAMTFAYNAHKEQVDKAGIPYIYHPIHLAEQMDTEILCTIALLHDVIEDTKYTKEDLEKEFPQEVMEALVLLTHDKNIDYFTYIQNIKKNKNARIVKLADLEHNMDQTRLSKRNSEQYEKYKTAKALLQK